MTCSNVLNIDQSPQELAELYGEQDYYAYLRSSPFREAFTRPLAAIVNRLGEPVLDVACGEGCLADYVTVPYAGFDGSATAIERGRNRLGCGGGAGARLEVGRFESPAIEGLFPTVVFGGILEVLVKPESRVSLLEMYVARYGARNLIVYDLERLDTYGIETRFGAPVEKRHCEVGVESGVIPAKRFRKVLLFQVIP